MPGEKFNEYEGILEKYYVNIFQLLFKDFKEIPFARYTSLPSFSPEYAYSVEQKNDQYFIISNFVTENYWYAKNRNKVKLKSKSKKIDKELYNVIGELFQLLAQQIRKPENDIFGLDGVNYYFATTDKYGNVIIGETWSPANDSAMDKLVKICDNLYSFGKGKELSQSKLQTEIKQLINSLSN